jgi:hypothetical protein
VAKTDFIAQSRARSAVEGLEESLKEGRRRIATGNKRLHPFSSESLVRDDTTRCSNGKMLFLGELSVGNVPREADLRIGRLEVPHLILVNNYKNQWIDQRSAFTIYWPTYYA